MAANTKKDDVIIGENTDNTKNHKLFSSTVILKNFEIPQQSIMKLVIREWVFELLPKLEMTFEDSGTYMDKYPIEDGDILSVEISTTDTDSSIVGEYQVESHEIINVGDSNSGGTIIELVAVMKNKDIYGPIHNRSFPKISSSEVISQIMSENEIETNIVPETKDVMTWLQINKSNKEFIDEVISRSFVTDDDLVLCYTETNNVTTYTTLGLALEADPKYILDFNPTYTIVQVPDQASSISYDSKDYEAIYYSDHEYYDISPMINKMGGHGSRISYYDSDVDGIVDVDSIDDNIKITNNSLKNKANVGTIYDYETRRYIEQSESGNVHGSYLKSIVQNQRKQNDFFSTYMTVVTMPNQNLRLMDKVVFMLPSSESDMYDYIHSNEYIVGGKVHDLDGKGFYTTRLFLYNNGVNADKSLMEDYQSKLNSKV